MSEGAGGVVSASPQRGGRNRIGQRGVGLPRCSLLSSVLRPPSGCCTEGANRDALEDGYFSHPRLPYSTYDAASQRDSSSSKSDGALRRRWWTWSLPSRSTRRKRGLFS